MKDETEELGMTNDDTKTEPLEPLEPREPSEPLEPREPGKPLDARETLAEPASDRRGPSVPTVVWGVLFALIAGAVMVNQTSDVDLNLGVSAPIALLLAGAVLVVWGVAGIGRSRRTP